MALVASFFAGLVFAEVFYFEMKSMFEGISSKVILWEVPAAKLKILSLEASGFDGSSLRKEAYTGLVRHWTEADKKIREARKASTFREGKNFAA